MAHNWSHEKVMRYRRAEPVDDFIGWMLVAGCAQHGARACLVSTLLKVPNPPTTLGALAGRLRCRFCRTQPEGVLLRKHDKAPAEDSIWLRYPAGVKPAERVPCGMERAEWWGAYIGRGMRRRKIL
ncbi:hypothetical protein BKE38_12580 [Pseudoroseomonas deserti]|uniref:Uncharacterized protein n=1 Tax=Teichococcus deserti TaxID=1817963 RepID=A0A1V2H1X8_9PROT|nr:hypothetical protein [Pseudoroseomonas deserti]ONG53291.1 hypothetical protein BKE38_12580 [Pseudoroseomonas deserti]